MTYFRSIRKLSFSVFILLFSLVAYSQSSSICDKEGKRYRFESGELKGSVYKGQWNASCTLMEGYGTMEYANGDLYQGEWKNGKRDGLGSCKWVNGDFYEGSWVNGKKEGHGSYKWVNEDSYTGDWVNGKMEGFGAFKSMCINHKLNDSYTGTESYTGQWKNGLRNGIGSYYVCPYGPKDDIKPGRWIKGIWVDGKLTATSVENTHDNDEDTDESTNMITSNNNIIHSTDTEYSNPKTKDRDTLIAGILIKTKLKSINTNDLPEGALLSYVSKNSYEYILFSIDSVVGFFKQITKYPLNVINATDVIIGFAKHDKIILTGNLLIYTENSNLISIKGNVLLKNKSKDYEIKPQQVDIHLDSRKITCTNKGQVYSLDF